MYSMPRDIAHEKSIQAAQKAPELDAMLPEAHSMLGAIRSLGFEWEKAEHEFRKAFELDPQSQEVWINYTWFYLIPLRRFDEGIEAMEEALVKDPLSLISHYFLGYLYYFIRKWDLAIEHWKTTLELDPQYHSAHMVLGLAYVQKGMIEEGICACETALRVYRNWSRGWVGLVYALAGRIDAARELLSELQDRARAEYVPSLDFALLHLGLGQIERCFDRLEKTVDEHDEKIFVFLPDVP